MNEKIFTKNLGLGQSDVSVTTKEEIIKRIVESKFYNRGSGNGTLYQEIPFEEFFIDSLKPKRTNSEDRLKLILEHSKDLQNKVVLDIGCNLGYFSFKLAEKGAICYGIDTDNEAIEIAKMLKSYKDIKNVHFFCSEFGNEIISEIKKCHKKIDIVIFFSINHWLLSSFHSTNKLVNTLRNLINNNQEFFYEPSSSLAIGGYYPEALEDKFTVKFLSDIGYSEIICIGKSFVSNINNSRDIWKGKIDFEEIAKNCVSFLNPTSSKKNKKIRQILNQDEFVFDNLKGRAVGFYKNYFVKIVSLHHNRFFSYENEARILEKMRGVAFVPHYYCYIDLNEYRLYFYSKLEGIPLSLIKKQKKNSDLFLKLEESLFNIIHELHKYGIIFRDLNPDNIIFNERDLQLFLVDFQWARLQNKEISINTKEDEQTLTDSLERIKKNGYYFGAENFSFETDFLTAQNIIHRIKIQNFERISTKSKIYYYLKKIKILMIIYRILKKRQN